MRAHEWVGAGPVRQAEAMRRGELTSRALTVATLSALDREDARLNAIVQMLTDEAFDAADDADRRRAAGEDAPLLGVPIAIKNDLDVAGRLTGRGSAAFTTPATHDGELVHLLKAAGMVPVATTTMPELAIYGFTESASRGITRNPHDLDRSPGGSSGGSAAVVAAGAVGIATASDGAGSIRIPAASCGVVGFKPTNGTMPESGGWGGLSVQGCVTPTLADSALYLQTFGSFAESLVDAVTSTPPPLRIGLSTSAAATTRPETLDPDVRDRMDQAAELLRGVGHEVETVRVHYGSDATSASVRYLRGIRTSTQTVERPDLLERRTRQIARLGRPIGPRMTHRARAAGERFGASVHERAGVDVLLMPVMSGTALHVGQFRRRGGLRTLLGMNAAYPYTLPWNHAGVPAVSMPAGVDAHGLPLAVQLVGRPGDDALLMSVAAQLEGKLR